jgi:hypothetical protein
MSHHPAWWNNCSKQPKRTAGIRSNGHPTTHRKQKTMLLKCFKDFLDQFSRLSSRWQPIICFSYTFKFATNTSLALIQISFKHYLYLKQLYETNQKNSWKEGLMYKQLRAGQKRFSFEDIYKLFESYFSFKSVTTHRVFYHVIWIPK